MEVALDTEFQAFPELEFEQTVVMECEATHNPSMQAADLGAELIPDLEFNQTLGW